MGPLSLRVLITCPLALLGLMKDKVSRHHSIRRTTFQWSQLLKASS